MWRIFAGILAANGDFDPLTLVQWGPLGVTLALIIFGFLWAKPAVDRLLVDKERAEAQRDSLISTYEKEIIPALRDYNTTAQTMLETVPDCRRVEAILTRVEVLMGRPSP